MAKKVPSGLARIAPRMVRCAIGTNYSKEAVMNAIRKFETKALIVFWVAIGIVFLLGGWVIALIFFFGWLPLWGLFVGVRTIVLYGNENWGAGKVPHAPVTPREMHRQ